VAAKIKVKSPKITIKCNAWDNWYGYISGRRVIAFFNTREATQEQYAERWKQAQEDILARRMQ